MSVLDQLRAIEQHVERRLRELAPIVAEYRDLQKVAERLGLKSAAEESTPTAPTARRGARAKPKAASSRGSGVTAARRSASRSATRRSTASAPSQPRASAASKPVPASTPPGASSSTRAKRKPAAAAAGSATGETATRRRAVAAPGSRQRDVLRLVSERPGISVAEIAKELGVDATGLYGVVRRLQAKGQIRKDGSALRPVAGAAPAPESDPAPSPAPTDTPEPPTDEAPAPPPSEPAPPEA
jgi:hypothetical protein